MRFITTLISLNERCKKVIVMGEKNRKINLKEYAQTNNVSDSQLVELLYSKVSQCSQISSVTPNPKVGIASIIGKFNNYSVEHKHEKIFVRAKVNYGISVLLSAFSVPFALWFVSVFDFDVLFSDYALPLSFLLISFGIAWLIGYILGDKEQVSILSYIYNILNEKPANSPVNNAKSIGANKILAIVPLIAGVVVLVLHFVL